MLQPRYVLLDRDGVINEDSDAFIKSPEEWLPIPGSIEAIALLNSHGYKVVVVTNQSGIARGFFDENTLVSIHTKMNELIKQQGAEITAVYFCPHGPDDQCDCRKPKAGLLLQFAQDFNVDLTTTSVIGDSLRDLQAGELVGAEPILVKTGKGHQTLINNPNLNALVFENLYDAAKSLIARHQT